MSRLGVQGEDNPVQKDALMILRIIENVFDLIK